MTPVFTTQTPLRLPNGRHGAPNPYHTEPRTSPDEWIRPPWPYAVVPARVALDAVTELRRLDTESSAVILGTAYDAARVIESMENMATRRSLTEILHAEHDLSLEEWIAAEIDRLERDKDDEDDDVMFDLFDPHAPPSAIPLRDDTNLAMGDAPLDVIIALVPTPDPTEVPALLGFGDFNGCEPPEYHVAMARRWRDRYGAQLVTCTGDTIEFQVASAITDHQTCLTIAREADAYNSDVGQVYGGQRELARHLRGATTWHLWWD